MRARQVTEALRALQDKHQLVKIGMTTKGPRRRDYNRVTLLSEAGTPGKHPRYTVPPGPSGMVAISRYFFTNLWIFALTDTELATLLVLSYKRAQFSAAHHTGNGVFVVKSDRKTQFNLTDTTWRSARMLHTFRLVEQTPTSGRDARNGKVTDFGSLWKKHVVMPNHFTINDDTMKQPAVNTIHQILTAPTEADLLRQQGDEWILGL